MTLVLAADPPVRVRVTDASGAPVAGVPVALRSAKSGADLVQASSASEGTVELPARGFRADLVRDGARVGLALLLREPVETPVDLAHVSPDPIELRLPPTGSIEVALLDERGQAWTQPTRIQAQLSPRTQAEMDAAQRCTVVTRWTQDGRASFAHVGLGIELRFEGEPAEREKTSVTLPGPRSAGERVAVRLGLGRAVPVVLGRILDEERRPIGPAQLSIAAHVGFSLRKRECTSDANGRFRCAFADGKDLALASELRIETELPADLALLGSIPAPRLGSGETDLGDVLLAPRPLRVSGSVLDEDGRPVPRAKVEFSIAATEGERGSGAPAADVLSDARGRFEFRGSFVNGDGALFVDDPEPIGVAVDAQGFLSFGPHLVPVGTTGLEVRLQRGGSFSGRVLFDGDRWPSLRLLRDGEVVSSARQRGHGTDGNFCFDGLAPGVYALRYGYKRDVALGTIEGIEVVTGKDTRDARLDPLDVRGRATSIALTVVDEDGRRVPDVSLGLAPPGTQRFLPYWLPEEDESDRLIVRAGPLPLRIQVEAPGFRTRVLEGVDSDQRVVLTHGIRVRLVLSGTLPALPRSWAIVGSLAPEPRDSAREDQEIAFDGLKTELYVSGAGRYALQYELVEEDAHQRLDQQPFQEDPAAAFDVLDEGSVQVFELRPPLDTTVNAMLAYIDAKE